MMPKIFSYNMKRYLVLSLLLCFAVSTAQVKKKKKLKPRYIPEKPKPNVDSRELDAFVLNGYKIVTYSYGDFNQDKKWDAVLLLKRLDEEEMASKKEDPIERPLIILMRNQDGKLQKVARNDRAVYCYKCGSDFGSPLTDIVIEGGTFSIQHEAGKTNRWTRLISFMYDELSKKFSLKKDATSFYNISGSDSVKSEVKTTKDFGEISFEDFDVYSKDLKQKKA